MYTRKTSWVLQPCTPSQGLAQQHLTFTGKLGPAVIADYVRAQAQCTAIFTKVVLATTETSATTNAMNYPLDSAERLMNAAGQMQ